MRAVFCLGILASAPLVPLAAAAAPPVAQDSRAVPPGTAAVVNGQAIPETAIQRALKTIPPSKQAEVRADVINFLVDNALIDQHLAQLNIAADPKAVEAKLAQFREGVKKQGSDFDKALKELMLTEEELRSQVASQLRWEKYVDEKATESVLRDLFDHNHDMFDGSMVRARHILLSCPAGDAHAAQAATAKLLEIRGRIEAEVARGLAEQPGSADSAGRERARAKLIDDAFAAAARKESACPSKSQGGDLGYFPRSGSMVEPFARAAFALRPYQMSDVVTTQFGRHLILVTDRRAGKEPKYEEVKEDVKEALGERLRDGLLARLRPTARIEIIPVKR